MRLIEAPKRHIEVVSGIQVPHAPTLKRLHAIAGLHLPSDEYAVIGSSAARLRGGLTRDPGDFDVIVTNDLFRALGERFHVSDGRQQEGSYQNPFQRIHLPGLGTEETDIFPLVYPFDGENAPGNAILHHTSLIDGVPVAELEVVKDTKIAFGRPQDLEDIRVIEENLRDTKYHPITIFNAQLHTHGFALAS